jgi:hypothetical protein
MSPLRGLLVRTEQRLFETHKLGAGDRSSGGHDDLQRSGRSPTPAANEHRGYDREQNTLERRVDMSAREERRAILNVVRPPEPAGRRGA